jgi:NADPH:quinone reductase-like Zn-dependent oxidoreductase
VVLDKENNLSFGTLPLRELGPTDVLIKVHSAPINPSDVMYTQGKYPAGKNKPTFAGFEGSGIVVQTGTDEKAKHLVGKKVCFFASGHDDLGTWGEYLVTGCHGVMPIPGNLSYEEAANSFVNPLTVEAMIIECEKKGHKAIVHSAAASNLGKMLIVACKQAKIDLICIVRREEQVQILKQLGAEHVLNSSLEAFEVDLGYKVNSLKASAFFDAVGGADGTLVFKHMPPHSTTYLYGALSGQGITATPFDLIFQSKTLRGFWLTEELKDHAQAAKIFASTFANLASREFTTTIVKKFPQEQFKEALEFYSQNATAGKVMLQNPHFEHS